MVGNFDINNLPYMSVEEIVEAVRKGFVTVAELRERGLYGEKLEKVLRLLEEDTPSFRDRDGSAPLTFENTAQFKWDTIDEVQESLPLTRETMPGSGIGSAFTALFSRFSLIGALASPLTRLLRKNTVFSALYAPAAVSFQKWFRLQLHLYDEKQALQVYRKAKRLDPETSIMWENALPMYLEKGMHVRAELSVSGPGVEALRATGELVWNGDLVTEIFVLKVTDPDLESIAGEVELFVEEARVGRLSFQTEVVAPLTESGSRKLAHAEPTKRVFLSYSHLDVKTASAWAEAYRSQGIDVFFDHESLKSGDVIDEEIMRVIEESDLFVLLWSKNAAGSSYIEREYRHALRFAYPQKDRESATIVIKPYSIAPQADPPAALKNLYHFKWAGGQMI